MNGIQEVVGSIAISSTIQKTRKTARDVFLRVISQRSMDVLTAALGPAQEWLDDLLEAQVQTLKDERNTIKAKVQAMAAPKS